MAKHEQAYERLGAKVLTLPDVIAQSVGFMGPVFVTRARRSASSELSDLTRSTA